MININELAKIDIESNIMEINQALEEAEDPLIHARYLQKCEVDKYHTFVESINLQGLCLTVRVAELIAKRLDTPEAYSEQITKTKEYVDNYKKLTEMPHESLDFIREELISQGIDDQFIRDVMGNDTDLITSNLYEGRASI